MRFKYCPNCGGYNTVIAESRTKSRCNKCREEFWNNPKATVAIIFVRGDEALFAKRGIEPNKGKYDFPGGFTEYGEDIYETCVREVEEEMDIKINKTDLTLLDGHTFEYVPGVSVVDLIFSVTDWEGDFTAQDDVAALEWKPLSFIHDDEFVRNYRGLEDKIKSVTG